MNSFEANGIAALLPGIGYVLQFVQKEVEHMLEVVNGDTPKTERVPRTAEHRNHLSTSAKNVWAQMSPMQRKRRIAKMNRSRLRRQVAQEK